MPSTESKSGVTNDGTLDVRPYVVVGPLVQSAGYGWGTYLWGGTNSGSGNYNNKQWRTDVNWCFFSSVNSTASFPSSGKIRIGSEDMEYTSNKPHPIP